MSYLTLHQPDAEPTYPLLALRRLLGRRDFKTGKLIKYVTALIESEGFPKPLPSWNQRKGLVRDVVDDSRWIAAGVDAWLADFLPPDLSAAIDSAAMAAAADEMDAMAGNLRLIQGGRV